MDREPERDMKNIMPETFQKSADIPASLSHITLSVSTQIFSKNITK
jgi:hypothetical protein